MRPDRTKANGKAGATFDFLGFTFYWARTRKGRWGMFCKTRSASLRRSIQSVYGWCRRHRHLPVKVQHQALTRRIQGHFNYFGVTDNSRALARFARVVHRLVFKWLNRRSQRRSFTWERFCRYMRRFPLPRPRPLVQLNPVWGTLV